VGNVLQLENKQDAEIGSLLKASGPTGPRPIHVGGLSTVLTSMKAEAGT
jgi:hypothetical protein